MLIPVCCFASPTITELEASTKYNGLPGLYIFASASLANFTDPLRLSLSVFLQSYGI